MISARAGSYIAAMAVALSCAMAASLLPKLRANSDIVEALASHSNEYTEFDLFRREFQLGRHEEIILVRSDDISRDETFRAFEDLLLELQLLDHVRQVVSIFSLPTNDGQSAFLSSPEMSALPTRLQLERLRQEAPFGARFIDAGNSATLLYVILAEEADRDYIRRAIENLAASFAVLKIELVGQAEIDRQVAKSMLRDNLIVTSVAILICFAASVLILRTWRAAFCCSVAPLVGLLWYLACLSATGTEIDLFMTVIPSVLIVLGFTDSMHFFYASSEARRELRAGAAVRLALRKVAVAAGLTSLTTAIAFAGFAFTGNEALSKLAIWGPVGLMLELLALVLVFPLTFALLFEKESSVSRPATFEQCLRIASFVARRPLLVSLAAVLLLLSLLPFAGTAVPTFRLDEHIPRNGQLRENIALLRDAELGGASIYLVAEDLDGQPGLSEKDRAQLEEILLVASAGSGSPLPVTVFSGQDSPFTSTSGNYRAIPLPMPLQDDADSLLLAVDDIEARLIQAGLDEETHLVGHSLLAAQLVPGIISDLRVAFYAALVSVALLLWLVFRSFRQALLATLVSVMPILLVEAILVITGNGLTLIGSLAFTLAFGIAVDDSIHLLNRLRQEKGSTKERISGALKSALPPMIGTSVILVAGLVATTISSVPGIPIFGLLVGSAIILALMADLLLLPGLLLWNARE